MTLAPIVLFCYNRKDHLMRTVEALLNNELALSSILYVYSDGGKSLADWDKVNDVRRYVDGIKGFHAIQVIKRNRNIGLANSIIEGVTDICERHGKVIVLEDDIVTSPFFLRYCNEALNVYENASDVVCIHGYTLPVGKRLPETFFIRGADCWGWATWARGWRLFNPQGRFLLEELERRHLLRDFDFGGTYPYSAMLRDQIGGNNNSWAIRWYASAFLDGKLTLYPGESLVQNIGTDASGTHTGSTTAYDVKLSDRPINVTFQPPVENKQARRTIESHFRHRTCGVPVDENIFRKKVMLCFVTMKKLLHLLMPPLLYSMLGKMRRLKYGQTEVPVVPEWEYLPGGWVDSPTAAGWNASGVLETYKAKWPRFVELLEGQGPLGVSHESSLTTREDIIGHNRVMTLGYVIAMASRNRDTLSLLDWGGGIGHFLTFARALWPRITIEYVCKDVPALAMYGKELYPDQTFSSDASTLDRQYDLVMASTSLQYSADWKATLLKLAVATRQYLYVTGLPVVEQTASYVFVQRAHSFGYNTEYQAWCVNRTEFMNVLAEAHVKLVREFIVGHKPVICGAPEQCVYRGFLFEKQ
jgi:putative methyltransferase (TIGR04325 family)